MCKIISVAITIVVALNVVQAGFLGSPLSYSSEFQAPVSYSAPHHFESNYAASHHFGSTFDTSYAATPFSATPFSATPFSATPFSATTFSAPHPHSYAVGYSAPPPPVVKYHGGSSFTTYGSVPSITKFSHSAAPVAVPSFYNSPLPYGAHSPLAYSGYSAPNTVVKYGPPITTTTTTYSTTAAVGGSYAAPLNAVAGWR